MRSWERVENPKTLPLKVSPPKQLAKLFEEFKELVEIPSAPGFEHGVSHHLIDLFKPFVDDIHVDNMGNVYGIIRGQEDGPIICAVAHTDSTSFVTQYIEPNGYVRFANQGLIPPYLSYVQRMQIITPKGRITGVVGSKPGHAMFNMGGAEGMSWPQGDMNGSSGVPMYDDQWVDIGAGSREEAMEMGVRVGQQMVYDRDLRWLGDGSTGMITCRGLDDKVGVQALVEAAKLLKGRSLKATVYFVGAVQEEIGLRGAVNASSLLDPDMCIGVDGDIAEAGPHADIGLGVGRSPVMGRAETQHRPGGGVYVSVNDLLWAAVAGLVGNQRINEKLIEIADRQNIKYDIEGNCRYITSDPAASQYSGPGGTPSVTLKIPVRYTHGPVEVASLHDVLAAGQLLAAFLEECGDLDLSFIDRPEAKAGVRKNRQRP